MLVIRRHGKAQRILTRQGRLICLNRTASYAMLHLICIVICIFFYSRPNATEKLYAQDFVCIQKNRHSDGTTPSHLRMRFYTYSKHNTYYVLFAADTRVGGFSTQLRSFPYGCRLCTVQRKMHLPFSLPRCCNMLCVCVCLNFVCLHTLWPRRLL